MDLRDAIAAEFERRRTRNPRYSLRAFARWLGTHHGTLAQLLDGRRRLTPKAAGRLCARLGLSPGVAWSSAFRDQADAVLRTLASPGARLDSRWLAVRLGIPLDDVNRAIHQLLRERRLSVRGPTEWTCHAQRECTWATR